MPKAYDIEVLLIGGGGAGAHLDLQMVLAVVVLAVLFTIRNLLHQEL